MKTFLRTWQGKALAALLALVLVAGAAVGIWAVTDPYDCCIAPGVAIGGLEVGGMTYREAKKALKAGASQTILAQPLTLLLPEEETVLTPEEVGVKLDTSAALRAAWKVGRSEEELPRRLGLLPYLTLDREAIRSALQDYANGHDTTLTQPGYRLVGEMPDLSTENSMESISCQSLEVTLGIPESHLDVEAALTLVESQYDLAYDCDVTSDDVLLHRAGLEMTVTAEPEAPDVDAIYKEVTCPPVDDSLNLQTHAFTYGSYGYAFDREAVAREIAQAAPGQTVTVDMTVTAPEILGEGVYFRDVLGSCQTKHNTNENRNTNLRVMCQALDGVVLQPGEEFSFNTVVGERTKEKGYLPAPAYSGNRLTNALGGGVCQGSSTLYNCVLLADLEVTDRSCHGAAINYLPLGLDAAVNWLTTDFCFRNNWNFPIKIQARVTEEYLEMEILGTDEKDYTVEMKAFSWKDGDTTWASSHMLKYDKETGELRSDERVAYSTYYNLD